MASQVSDPRIDQKAFQCPHCHAYAQMNWGQAVALINNAIQQTSHRFSQCVACTRWSLWVTEIERSPVKAVELVTRLAYPNKVDAPLPPIDLPDACRPIYEEARQILAASPRASAALLRLCIETLCKELGESGNLNAMIGSLVKKGMPITIQQALDVVRVTGNDAIHPGEIHGDTDKDARTLFRLVSLIVEYTISGPKHIQAAFDGLPQEKRDQIAKRDSLQKPGA